MAGDGQPGSYRPGNPIGSRVGAGARQARPTPDETDWNDGPAGLPVSFRDVFTTECPCCPLCLRVSVVNGWRRGMLVYHEGTQGTKPRATGERGAPPTRHPERSEGPPLPSSNHYRSRTSRTFGRYAVPDTGMTINFSGRGRIFVDRREFFLRADGLLSTRLAAARNDGKLPRAALEFFPAVIGLGRTVGEFDRSAVGNFRQASSLVGLTASLIGRSSGSVGRTASSIEQSSGFSGRPRDQPD